MFHKKTQSHNRELNDSNLSLKKYSISKKDKLDEKATSLRNKENNRNGIVQSDKSSKSYRRVTAKKSSNSKTLKKKKVRNPFNNKELKKYFEKRREEFKAIDKYKLHEEIYIPVHDVGLLPENSKSLNDPTLPIEDLLGIDDPICKLVSQSNSKEKKCKSKLKNMEDISNIVESKLKSKESVSDSEDICNTISYGDDDYDNPINNIIETNFDDTYSNNQSNDEIDNHINFDSLDNALENSYSETESNDMTMPDFNDCMTEIEKLLKCIEISEKCK